MPLQSPPQPPFRLPAMPEVANSSYPTAPAQVPDGSPPAEHNEFSDAVARMFEHRQRLSLGFSPPLGGDTPAREEVDLWAPPGSSWLSPLLTAGVLRGLVVLGVLAALGYAIAWFVYLEPSHDSTASPTAEAKPEASQVAAPLKQLPPHPLAVAEPEPPAEVVTTPVATVPSVAPAAPAAPAASAATALPAAPLRPLTKEEIKEMQAKLNAAGFNSGPVDGVLGPQTQAAVTRYAQARKLATSDATQETLIRLRSEPHGAK